MNTNEITQTSVQDDEVLTQKQLAERLQKSVRTIQNWKARGELPFTRIGNSILFHWGSCKKKLGMQWDEQNKEARKELQFQAS